MRKNLPKFIHNLPMDLKIGDGKQQKKKKKFSFKIYH